MTSSDILPTDNSMKALWHHPQIWNIVTTLSNVSTTCPLGIDVYAFSSRRHPSFCTLLSVSSTTPLCHDPQIWNMVTTPSSNSTTCPLASTSMLSQVDAMARLLDYLHDPAPPFVSSTDTGTTHRHLYPHGRTNISSRTRGTITSVAVGGSLGFVSPWPCYPALAILFHQLEWSMLNCAIETSCRVETLRKCSLWPPQVTNCRRS